MHKSRIHSQEIAEIYASTAIYEARWYVRLNKPLPVSCILHRCAKFPVLPSVAIVFLEDPPVSLPQRQTSPAIRTCILRSLLPTIWKRITPINPLSMIKLLPQPFAACLLTGSQISRLASPDPQNLDDSFSYNAYLPPHADPAAKTAKSTLSSSEWPIFSLFRILHSNGEKRAVVNARLALCVLRAIYCPEVEEPYLIDSRKSHQTIIYAPRPAHCLRSPYPSNAAASCASAAASHGSSNAGGLRRWRSLCDARWTEPPGRVFLSPASPLSFLGTFHKI